MTRRQTTDSTRLAGFLRVVNAHPGRLLIICHHFPDPDCIAAALGVQAMLRHAAKREADLYCGSSLGRPENKAMVGILDIAFVEPEDVGAGTYAAAIMVDTQPFAGNNTPPEGVPVIAVFDHHEPPERKQDAAWLDVREDAGCTSSMICSYLNISGTPIDNRLATALFLGIRTDTANLERDYAVADITWYERLLPLVDRSIMGLVIHPKMPEGYFALLRQALDEARRYDDVVVCNMGALPAPDLLSEISELFMRLKGINWSLATGVYENRLMLSMRAGPGRKAGSALMESCQGITARVGGHGRSAGGMVLCASFEEAQGIADRICAGFVADRGVSAAGPRPICIASESM